MMTWQPTDSWRYRGRRVWLQDTVRPGELGGTIRSALTESPETAAPVRVPTVLGKRGSRLLLKLIVPLNFWLTKQVEVNETSEGLLLSPLQRDRSSRTGPGFSRVGDPVVVPDPDHETLGEAVQSIIG